MLSGTVCQRFTRPFTFSLAGNTIHAGEVVWILWEVHTCSFGTAAGHATSAHRCLQSARAGGARRGVRVGSLFVIRARVDKYGFHTEVEITVRSRGVSCDRDNPCLNRPFLKCSRECQLGACRNGRQEGQSERPAGRATQKGRS